MGTLLTLSRQLTSKTYLSMVCTSHLVSSYALFIYIESTRNKNNSHFPVQITILKELKNY